MDKFELVLQFIEVAMSYQFSYFNREKGMLVNYGREDEREFIVDGRKICERYWFGGASLQVGFKSSEERIARSRALRPWYTQSHHEQYAERSLKLIEYKPNFKVGMRESITLKNIGLFGESRTFWGTCCTSIKGNGTCVLHEEGYRLLGFEKDDDSIITQLCKPNIDLQLEGRTTQERERVLAQFINAFG